MEQYTKTMEELEKQRIKMQSYWTLGRYDGVTIIEVPSARAMSRVNL